MESFIISLISGHLFSKGADAGQSRLQRYMQEKDLSGILDEYDAAFMRYHDTEITLNKCDMGTVFEKRAFLISCAKECFKKDNSDIKNNMKEEFIDNACKQIGDSSEVIKTYLDQFFLLVFTKETKYVSVAFRALLNAYTDSQHEINKKTDEKILMQDKKIGRINKTLKEMMDNIETSVNFTPYYQNVEERFTEEKDEESIVGGVSDDKAYIDAYIETEYDSVPVLSFLEDWFGKKKSGAMLIYGEPGHGKTTLCRKAMVEFYRGEYLKGKAKNVIAVSLNTGENQSIISEGKVLISNALAWGVEQERRFSFEDCRDSLLFLDGFDEFIDDAKRIDPNIDNICSFMKRVNNIAKTYDIHIIVLSRAVAVENDLRNLTGICNYYKLSPVSEMQQDEWLECHTQNSGYKETFKRIRENSDMYVLLGVPLLFRLIVHNQFDGTSSNVVELYNNLFIHLMNKRNIFKDFNLKSAEQELMTLAYEIYCTDSNMAVLENVAEDPHWLFTFYVKAYGSGKIGFFHRSFYQYFLAKYIYLGIIDLKEKEESFIGLFAERELDDTILQYLSFFIKEEDKSIIYPTIEKLINTLSETEAYINFEPHVDSGDAEKSRILRSTNIYRNTLNIVAAFSYVIQLPFEDNLDLLMRTYNSNSIVLVSDNNKRANLSNVNLSGANLSQANMRGVCLRKANLNGANLSDANLSRADLKGTSLIRADLRKANLNRAFLKGAYLVKTELNEAEMSEAILSGANLNGADLSGADLRGADLRRSSLEKTDLSEVNLNGADLSSSNLSDANLRAANLDNAYLMWANLKGANLLVASLKAAYLKFAYLNGANLKKANLSRANLSRVDLSIADLYRANLSGGDLRNANLSRANLSRVNLRNANLSRADLSEAILWGANLSGADLSEANLSRADLSRANLLGANLSRVDLVRAVLYQAKIDVIYKDIIDPSAEGYSSIEWISNEDDKY